MAKKIIILAGPNGAGKTTFARSFLPSAAHCPRFVSADLIAAGLSPSTSYARHIAKWREAGYRVSLFFLTLKSADVAVSRVAHRVRQGGHNIPEAVKRRRFAAGLRNFEDHYRHIVNEWITFRTLKSGPQVIK